MDDLKIIKKKYGEEMAHLCRSLFPTLLEEEGKLSSLLLAHFEPSRILYYDIKYYEAEYDFQNYLLSFTEERKQVNVDNLKSPSELLSDAGYILYECKSEEDIQKFLKYYAPGEELCTFKEGNRLSRCHVFFAVKKDVENIKREDFINPHRQDLYGTSVISIQFTRDDTHSISIKNRYNHTVHNCDATFSNNLDYIIPGLTASFAKYYGLVQTNETKGFDIGNYKIARDGKWYRFNYEINGIYYCPDNIILDQDLNVLRFEKEKYIVCDYFILDLVNKKFSLFDSTLEDSFPDIFTNIKKIEVISNNDNTKTINITLENDNNCFITMDRTNKIIGIKHDSVVKIENNFLAYNKILNNISLSSVEEIGDFFLRSNKNLKEVSLCNARIIGKCFITENNGIREINLPNAIEIGSRFLYNNNALIKLDLPKVLIIGDSFMKANHTLRKLDMASVEKIGNDFLTLNGVIIYLNISNVKEIGSFFLMNNNSLRELDCPFLEKVGDFFLYHNYVLNNFNAPLLDTTGIGGRR